MCRVKEIGSFIARCMKAAALSQIFICNFLVITGCKKRDSSEVKEISTPSPRQDGACGASGAWTQTAFEKADALLKVINSTMVGRKECQAVVNSGWKLELIKQNTASPRQLDYRVGRFMTLPKEIASLAAFMNLTKPGAEKSSLTGMAQEALLDRFIELRSKEGEVMVESNMASSITPQADGTMSITRAVEGLNARILASNSVGLARLDEVFTTLAESENCIGKLGAAQESFLLTSLQMLGAFASADTSISSQIGKTVRKYVTFLNSMYQAKTIRSTTDARLRETISCLIDTVSYTYCGARDAKVILDLSYDWINSPPPAPTAEDGSNPFYGLNVLTNYIPVINKWLLGITQGVAMRSDINGRQIVGLMEVPADLVAYRKELDKSFEQGMYKIAGITDEKSRQAAMAGLLNELAYQIGVARFPRSMGGLRRRSQQDIPNLLDGQGLTYRIPFLLGGMSDEKIPKAAIPGNPAAALKLMSIEDVVVAQGPLTSMASFELFRSTLRRNLTSWMDSGTSYGMTYFWKNYPVDYLSVASQIGVGLNVTPIAAFKAVRLYLVHFLQVAKTSALPAFVAQTPVVLDLLQRLDTIVEAHEGLSRSSDSEAAQKFIRLVYQQLDMVIFSEIFIQERLLPTVLIEVNAMMAKQIPGKDDLVANILNVAETATILNLYQRVDANKLKVDLASAMFNSEQALQALQSIAGNPLEDNLVQLQKRAFGAEWDADAVRADSYRKSIRDTMAIPGSSSTTRYQDRFSSSMVDWVLLVQPRAALRRSLHPDLYPVPPAGGFRGFTDDENSSFSTLWGYLCAQSLALPNRERYRKICSGSSFGIDAPATLPETSRGEVKLNYDTWWSNWERKRYNRTGWNGEDPICSTYDLERRWKIYYMSLDHVSSSK